MTARAGAPQLLWTWEITEGMKYFSFYGNYLYGGDGQGRILALDWRNGAVRWDSGELRLEKQRVLLHSLQAIAGGVVFHEPPNVVTVVNEDGTLRWKAAYPSRITGFRASNDDVVIATEMSVTCLDLRNGARRWGQDRIVVFESTIAITPDGSKVAVAGTNPFESVELLLLDAHNGMLSTRVTGAWFRPVWATDQILIITGGASAPTGLLTDETGVTAFDRTGMRLWRVPRHSHSGVVNHSVVAGGPGRGRVGFDVRTGRELWQWPDGPANLKDDVLYDTPRGERSTFRLMAADGSLVREWPAKHFAYIAAAGDAAVILATGSSVIAYFRDW